MLPGWDGRALSDFLGQRLQSAPQGPEKAVQEGAVTDCVGPSPLRPQETQKDPTSKRLGETTWGGGVQGGWSKWPPEQRDASFRERDTGNCRQRRPQKLSRENIIFELCQVQSKRQLQVLSVQVSLSLPLFLPVPTDQLRAGGRERNREVNLVTHPCPLQTACCGREMKNLNQV